MGTLLFGYMYSSAAVSSQLPGSPIDVAVFPISGHTTKTRVSATSYSSQNDIGVWENRTRESFKTNYVGAIACCMYAWDPDSGKWVPYVAA